MSLLPAPLGHSELRAWRLDETRYASEWDSGEGARLAGGRWNSMDVPCVYCALDAATAIVEVAVHRGFRVLNTVPFTLTAARILKPDDVHIVRPGDIPNARWLQPGAISAGQQAFGDELLSAHTFVAVPSTVVPHSWNLLFLPRQARGAYRQLRQDALPLDPRLDPVKPAAR